MTVFELLKAFGTLVVWWVVYFILILQINSRLPIRTPILIVATIDFGIPILVGVIGGYVFHSPIRGIIFLSAAFIPIGLRIALAKYMEDIQGFKY